MTLRPTAGQTDASVMNPETNRATTTVLKVMALIDMAVKALRACVDVKATSDVEKVVKTVAAT